MNLLQALNPAFPLCTAVVGAGGKTSTMAALARQVEGAAWVTTTTHLGTDQTAIADLHCVLETEKDINPAHWLQQKVTLLTGAETNDGRLHSPTPELLEEIRLASEHNAVHLIFEADGSRSIPLKAPGDHEPPIPAWARQVIIVVGASALGNPLNEQTVFRAGRYAELTGLLEGQTITIESVRDMLLHPLGGLKNIPPGALKAVLFNQAEDLVTRAIIEYIVPELLAGGYDRIIIGGVKHAPEALLSH
ncbi:MAG: putative selenium-dependent hydroxylase accessory protein YqeC [Chloroflexi bacterium HGW-Chloroflexi-4]|jgi:molybdenum cofactor cytidylyltransferase|nr:MAG: putative selenium-dependent hydroxylase accessory protein YqeC [Chloroflexi bacterium HGW-Chloroflexi-4]